VRLRTERLCLREYVVSDVDATHTWRCDERYLEHYPGDGFDRNHTVELIERFIRWQTRSPRWRWQLAFERLDTRELIGSGGVRKTSVDADSADVGYELDPRHWGQGLATEGMSRLVRFAFDEAGLHQLTARAVCTNQRSHRVLERLGFECAKTIPAGLGKDGTPWPERYECHLVVDRGQRAPETAVG